ncbi:MAG: DUF3786 domain-containing protein [Planctomycetota bacterium]
MPVELPEQTNYQVALDKAWAVLKGRPSGDIAALGAARVRPGVWRLPVLEAEFEVDIEAQSITVVDDEGKPGAEPGVAWRILALHYLLAPVHPGVPERLVSFAEIPEARGYSKPYQDRVIGRFCHTVGGEGEAFRRAGEALRGQVVSGGDLAIRFLVFPRLPVTVVWYAGDEEFPPGANFLFEDCVTDIFVVEDVVVTAERLVSRLCGKPW